MLMDKEQRLKLAVQKSGRLTDPSLDLLGRCGLKLARGATANFEALRYLDFGRCRLTLAVPQGTPFTGPEALRGKRIATTYPLWA